MHDNYFFLDGSALLADYWRLVHQRVELKGRRLDIRSVARHFTTMGSRFTGSGFRRVVFYFADGDSRVERDLVLPDVTRPGYVEDLSVKFCGKRVDRDGPRAEQWLSENNAPPIVTDRLRRSEKAVDTQICCDALRLAAVQKLDRLFLYTNDYDFAPLCETLKDLGVNVNLIRLYPDNPNRDLLQHVDGFSCMGDHQLLSCLEAEPKAQAAVE